MLIVRPVLADDSTTQPTLASEAFDSMVKNYFPLTPHQIHKFKNRASEQAQANATPPGPSPAKGTSGTILVSMKPGQTMPAVRVGQGMITSMVFTDKAGKVWPIESYSIGDPKAFNVQWNKSGGVLMIQGQKLFAQTNMGVMLQGMKIPVMLTLLIGQKKWDYLDYIRVQAYQPEDSMAEAETTSKAPEFLVKLLDGIPPMGSHSLTVNGGDAKVWSYNGDYVLLSRSSLLSPAWTSKFVGTGPSPLKAYELPKAPYILLSNNGQIERLTVSGEAPQ